MMSPDYWRFRRSCATVHRFSMEVIQKRRAALKEMKVGTPSPLHTLHPSHPHISQHPPTLTASGCRCVEGKSSQIPRLHRHASGSKSRHLSHPHTLTLSSHHTFTPTLRMRMELVSQMKKSELKWTLSCLRATTPLLAVHHTPTPSHPHTLTSSLSPQV